MTILVAIVALSGCATEQWEAVSLVDQGVACLEAEADATGTMLVDAQTCLSSSCDRGAAVIAAW